ncbi:hypothetical protein MTBBW1_1730049 [Desulfamplus magnetovallimortis]|uniref:Flagellar protein FliL n=1 Tax=Desulfamplus magnetovallimortis TaxID=1246637 RepID=A0A1W1H9V2_9BACT|nr:flagellar basal body-associated FliL family protein [Desulfamplus magnetovallimortis]SLM29251.1 hypothetical protein MTBBW1_1730049 [Desulfamplus magnetovallimortis]
MFKKKDKKKDSDNKEEKKTPPSAGEESSSGEGSEVEKKPFLKKILSLKFIIIMLVIILVVGGGAFAGWFFFLKKSPPEDGDIASQSAEAEAPENQDGEALPPPEPDFPDVVDLPAFEEIAIQESGNMNHITFKISVELAKPELRDSFESNMELIQTTVQSEVEKMTWFVLRNPDGKIRLKYNIIKALNGALPGKMVKNVFFTELILH